MTGGELHPAPHRDRLTGLRASLLLYTGPLAWFVQLNVGVMMTSWPCFPSMDRLDRPLPGYEWTHIAALAVLVASALVASIAGLLSWRKFVEVREEEEGGHAELIELGHGRTRFVALWGTYLGLGFALATLVTLVAFAMVSRCLG
jgi:hypothetical protein